MAGNVWMQNALAVEAAHGGRREEMDAIRAEYAVRSGPGYQPRACSCGHERHFKMTVGAFKCPVCGALETFAGEVL